MLSIVVPVLNEEESLSAFYAEVTKVVSHLSREYEVVFIDDGSTDHSLHILKEFMKHNKHIRVFSFRTNHGKAEALTLGFQMARGDRIVTMDADLQDRPDQIEKLLQKMDDNYELVSGWRENRHDSLAKIIASRMFNTVAGWFWGLQLHDYNCGLKVYTRDAAKNLFIYGGMHRFIPLIAYQQGFSVTEVAVLHDERKYGKSKYEYGFLKLFRNFPDMFTMLFLVKYSKRPLHFFGFVGSILFLIGFFQFVYLWVLQLQGHAIGRRPLLIISMSLMLAGLQVFFTGFLAELMINIHSGKNAQEYLSHLRFNSDEH